MGKLPIESNFNTEMEELTVDSSLIYTETNKARKQMLDNDEYLRQELLQSATMISDTEPTQPCSVWLRPMGGKNIAGSIGSGTAQTVNLSAYVGEEEPEKSVLWFNPKPIQ